MADCAGGLWSLARLRFPSAEAQPAHNISAPSTLSERLLFECSSCKPFEAFIQTNTRTATLSLLVCAARASQLGTEERRELRGHLVWEELVDPQRCEPAGVLRVLERMSMQYITQLA